MIRCIRSGSLGTVGAARGAPDWRHASWLLQVIVAGRHNELHLGGFTEDSLCNTVLVQAGSSFAAVLLQHGRGSGERGGECARRPMRALFRRRREVARRDCSSDDHCCAVVMMVRCGGAIGPRLAPPPYLWKLQGLLRGSAFVRRCMRDAVDGVVVAFSTHLMLQPRQGSSPPCHRSALSWCTRDCPSQSYDYCASYPHSLPGSCRMLLRPPGLPPGFGQCGIKEIRQTYRVVGAVRGVKDGEASKVRGWVAANSPPYALMAGR